MPRVQTLESKFRHGSTPLDRKIWSLIRASKPTDEHEVALPRFGGLSWHNHVKLQFSSIYLLILTLTGGAATSAIPNKAGSVAIQPSLRPSPSRWARGKRSGRRTTENLHKSGFVCHGFGAGSGRQPEHGSGRHRNEMNNSKLR